MPRFKTVKFRAVNSAGATDEFSTEINIKTNGTFYCRIPCRLHAAFSSDVFDRERAESSGFFTVSAPTLAELESRIHIAHRDFMRPSVEEEPVILYNIESHVSFAMTSDGRICPNAGFPGAEWINKDCHVYGDHHSSNPAVGGYSLTIGAKARMKKTICYGEHSRVSYSIYNKGEDHLGRENPAQLLNSWTSMSLPENPKEMPYSDEAAMFFFNLLIRMAELNRRIQEFTKTPERIEAAIRENAGVLLLGNRTEVGLKKSGSRKAA